MRTDRIKHFFVNVVGNWLRKNSTIVWSFSIALLFFGLARVVYFDNNKFFGYSFLGETLTAAVAFLLVFFFGKTIVLYINQLIERYIVRLFSTVLYEFWVNQSSKLAENLKRQLRDRESDSVPEEENYFSECPPIVLDTSAIIDGRVLGIIKSGFLDNTIIVTQSVIDELKNMADKSNQYKKEKGRRGLDILNDIKKATGKSRFKIIDTHINMKLNGSVDKSLLDFCVKTKAKIITLDFNLNKAAQVSNVPVLNVNKLSNEVKVNLTPGDIVLLKLLQEGKESGQSVGYLDDGTMIVVRDSSNFIGQHKEVVIEKVIQTDAGKMIFAYLTSLEI